MSLHRFFLETSLVAGTEPVTLPLSAADVHHSVGVLRVREGEQIEVVDPDGRSAFRVSVKGVSAAGIVGSVVERLQIARTPRVTLVQGVAKGEKMDAIVRQAVEVGADQIVPVLTERSVVKLDARKAAEKAERWRRIARSGAEQAHRDRVPDVREPASLRATLDYLAGFDGVIVLWEESTGPGIAETVADLALASDARLAVVVGPEGGLSADEVAALQERGARVATLGPTILRTETAAIIALALAVHELGGLGAVE